METKEYLLRHLLIVFWSEYVAGKAIIEEVRSIENLCEKYGIDPLTTIGKRIALGNTTLSPEYLLHPHFPHEHTF